jgi:hypothetical protein
MLTRGEALPEQSHTYVSFVSVILRKSLFARVAHLSGPPV